MTRFFVRHPVTTWMLFTAFVVLGLYAVPRIEVEALPEVDLPSLTVFTRWNGASPKAIQRSITLPIEEAVRNLHGVESVKSTSRAGQSMVSVEFRREIDIDFARLDLNEQLGSVRRTLPLNASQPQIMAFVPEDFRTEQFFTFSIESEMSPNGLREFAEEWIVPQVRALDGVADAQVIGGARSLLKILLDRQKLELYGIDGDQVFAAVDHLDELSGAGAVHEDGLERLVAVREPVDLRRIERAVVARRGERAFRLEQLGTVRPDFEDPAYFVRGNGRTVIQVQVEKRSGSNSVSVSRALRAALPQIEARAPADVTLAVDVDEGRELENKLSELVVRCVVILVLLFLLLVVTLRRVQLTAIVVASVLFALVICLSLFYFLKLSVNFITISGLTICFGMLLDNSILVLDAIHRRLRGLRETGYADLSHETKRKAATATIVAGTNEVMFPILATTATTIVAFASFIFLSGRLALYYVPLAVAVGTAMFASVFVAFGWIPVVLHQTWVPRFVRKSRDGDRVVADPAALEALVEDVPDLESKPRFAQRVVHASQRMWWVIVPALVALGFWGHVIYRDDVINGGFWQMPDKEKLIFFMRMPEGTDIRVTSETMFGFEQALMPVRDGAHMRSQVFGNIAYMEIEFDDFLMRTGIPALYRALLTERADITGGTTIYIGGFGDQPYFKGTPRGSGLNSLIKITGYNSKRLAEIANRTLATVERNRRARKARITGTERFGEASTEETVITLRRDRLADNNLSVLAVVNFIRRLLGVDTPWTMLVEGEQEQVQLSFADADSIQFSEIADQVLESPNGTRVRLGDLVTMETLPLSDTIVRENQRYSTLVNWEYVGTDHMRSAFIKRILDTMDLPYGYSAEEAQQSFLTEQEEEDLRLTLILAAVFILMVMMALFESWSLPFLVLTSIPMALFGVVVLFWQTTSSFDSSAKIGLVLLFGVVVNNAILLVSRFRNEAGKVLKIKLGGDPFADAALFEGQRRRLGGGDLWYLPVSPKERSRLLRRAIGRGTMIKLRSVLLTSGTTIVGLLPLLLKFEWSPMEVSFLHTTLPFSLSWMEKDNQDIWQNLALTSIGGLVSSTVLILICMPALYYASVKLGWALRRIGGWIAALWRWLRVRLPLIPTRAESPARPNP